LSAQHVMAAPAALVLVLLLHASATHACGYCVEDKVAAVYDGAVVTRAVEQKHRVAFFALAGSLPAHDPSLKQAIERTAQSVQGVDPSSARVSLETAALSFSFDPVRTPFAVLYQRMAQKLAARGISLELLSIMERPADLKVTRGAR
jgi:hypothetical protein